ELRIRPLFEGFRGLPFDRIGLVHLLVRFSELLYASEGIISQMDLNPLVYSSSQGWMALDAKILLSTTPTPRK
ncbi:MAG: acetate--CoA ligase family protein, partial [Spirochaetales bacterium]